MSSSRSAITAAMMLLGGLRSFSRRPRQRRQVLRPAKGIDRPGTSQRHFDAELSRARQAQGRRALLQAASLRLLSGLLRTGPN